MKPKVRSGQILFLLVIACQECDQVMQERLLEINSQNGGRVKLFILYVHETDNSIHKRLRANHHRSYSTIGKKNFSAV